MIFQATFKTSGSYFSSMMISVNTGEGELDAARDQAARHAEKFNYSVVDVKAISEKAAENNMLRGMSIVHLDNDIENKYDPSFQAAAPEKKRATAKDKAAAINNNRNAFIESMDVHVTTGNGKTGIDSINLIPGSKNADFSGARTPELLEALETATGEKCVGTCDNTCKGCYAMRMTRYPDVLINLFENTILAKRDPVAFVNRLEQLIYGSGKAPELFRIHDSGDFFSYEYFVAIVEMIRRHPETQYGAYTKAADYVYKYGIDNLPANFSLQCSPWEGYCDPIGDLPQFIYDAAAARRLRCCLIAPLLIKTATARAFSAKIANTAITQSGEHAVPYMHIN